MIFNNVELHNVQELLPGETDGELILSRVPNDLRISLNENARQRVLEAAGCELRFNLKSEQARIVLRCTERPSVIEVWQGCFFQSWQVVGTEPTEIIVARPLRWETLQSLADAGDHPFSSNLTRLILPWRPEVRLIGMEGEFEPPAASQTPSQKCLFYGSSITHGSMSVGPSETFAMTTARLLGVDLFNLGMGAGAHLEKELADYIAAHQDFHTLVLELGINLINHIDTAEFEKRVTYFLQTVSSAHSHKPIFCTDLFTCYRDFENDEKIAAFREIVARQVEALQSPKVFYVKGNELLPNTHTLTTDLVHPSPDGMREIAENLTRFIRQRQ